MPGPFTSYAPPGVYTQTEIESTPGTLPSNIRIPALIGVGLEVLTVSDFELFRGSSPFGDMYVPDEDVSNQIITGEEVEFQVTHYPITTGEGVGATTEAPSDVKVLVNGEETPVNQVDGVNGIVKLLLAPGLGATVKISYYFHRSDTSVTDEDVSAQANGSTNVFRVANFPITDGSGSGLPTTDITAVSAMINSVAVGITEVDGQNGLVSIEIPTEEITYATVGNGTASYTVTEDPIVTPSGVITNDPSYVSVTTTIGTPQTNDALAVVGQTGVVTIPYYTNNVTAESVTAQLNGTALTYTLTNDPVVTSVGALATLPTDVLVNITAGSGTPLSSIVTVDSINALAGTVTLSPFLISDNTDFSATANGVPATLGAAFLLAKPEIVDTNGAITNVVTNITVNVAAGTGTDPVAPVAATLNGTTGSITFDVDSLIITDTYTFGPAVGGETAVTVPAAQRHIVTSTGVTASLPAHLISVTRNGSPFTVDTVNGTTGVIDFSVSLPGGLTALDTVVVTFRRLPNVASGDTLDVDYLRLPNVTAPTDTATITYKYGTLPAGADDVEITYSHRDLPDVAESDVVEISYTFNTFRNTFDYLPKSGVTEITRVGNTEGRANYFEPTDYTLIDDTIHWGSVVNATEGTVQTGSVSLETKFTANTIVDDKVHLELATGVVNSINKEFTIRFTPVDGSGTGTETENPLDVRVYVGTNATTAFAAPAVTVAQVSSADKKITLQNAPAAGSVFVTYYTNRLTDDTYTFTVTDTANNEYTIESGTLGPLSTAQIYVPAGSTTTAYIKPVLTTVGASETGEVWARFISISEIEYYDGDPSGSGVLIGTARQNQTFVTPAGTDAPEGVWVSIGTSSEFAAGGYQSFQFNTNQTLRIVVTQGGDFTTIFNPLKFDRYQVPGVVYVISNTTSVLDDDTAILTAYNKSGAEPDISAPYYVTFKYNKSDYSPRLYTAISDVVRDFGTINSENRVSLAANLAFLNGAPGVIIKQVQRATGSTDAAALTYIAALEDIEFPVGGISPAVIVPLTTNSTVQTAVKTHVEIQSSIRYKNERIAILGSAPGTTKDQIKTMAEGFTSNRVWLVYPDIAVISLVDSAGREIEQIVDGSIVAAALAGLNTSLAFDVATPMTNKSIAGFKRLGRRLRGVDMDNIAGSGVMILYEKFPAILIRDGLTTDMSNIFTRQSQVITISDTVQQTARANLAEFIGNKFLSGKEELIKNKLASALAALKQANIIFGFRQPVIKRGNEPDTVLVDVSYQPVFGLNYIVATFKLNSSI